MTRAMRLSQTSSPTTRAIEANSGLFVVPLTSRAPSELQDGERPPRRAARRGPGRGPAACTPEQEPQQQRPSARCRPRRRPASRPRVTTQPLPPSPTCVGHPACGAADGAGEDGRDGDAEADASPGRRGRAAWCVTELPGGPARPRRPRGCRRAGRRSSPGRPAPGRRRPTRPVMVSAFGAGRLDRDDPVRVLGVLDEAGQRLRGDRTADRRSSRSGRSVQDEAEDGERQRDGREDGEEGEVADAAGEDVAAHVAVALPGPPRRGWPAGGRAAACRCRDAHRCPTRPSAGPASKAKACTGAPHAVGAVLVEVELLDHERAVVVGQLVERAVQSRPPATWWATVTCGW